MNVYVALDVHVPNFTALDIAALWLIPIFVIAIVILSIRGIVREIHKERFGDYGDYGKIISKNAEDVEKRDKVLENGDWYCKDCGNLNSSKAIYCSCGSKKSDVKEEKE